MTVTVTESGQQQAVTDWGQDGQAAGERSTHHQSNTIDMMTSSGMKNSGSVHHGGTTANETGFRHTIQG